MFASLPTCRYCQQVLNETLRTAKLTPIAARLQEVEGKVDQHLIPKEVCDIWIVALQAQRAFRAEPSVSNPETCARIHLVPGFRRRW